MSNDDKISSIAEGLSEQIMYHADCVIGTCDDCKDAMENDISAFCSECISHGALLIRDAIVAERQRVFDLILSEVTALGEYDKIRNGFEGLVHKSDVLNIIKNLRLEQ